MTMTTLSILAVLAAIAAIAMIMWAIVHSKQKKQIMSDSKRRFIESYVFPAAQKQKLYERFPALNTAQIEQILEGLRQWFLLLMAHRGQKFGMPSKAVDTAWHEFILMTRQYQSFCDSAFGKYLHHAPNEGGTARKTEDLSLARTYALAPATAMIAGGVAIGGASAIGLFDIDGALGIDGGLHYDDTARAEMMKRHTTSQQGGDGSSATFSTDKSRDDSSGHGLEGGNESSGGSGSSSDGGGGDGGGGGCGGGCGS
jgi:hypothetical protein